MLLTPEVLSSHNQFNPCPLESKGGFIPCFGCGARELNPVSPGYEPGMVYSCPCHSTAMSYVATRDQSRKGGTKLIVNVSRYRYNLYYTYIFKNVEINLVDSVAFASTSTALQAITLLYKLRIHLVLPLRFELRLGRF